MMKPKRKREQGYPRWFYGFCIFAAVLFASLFYLEDARTPLLDASPTPNLDYLKPVIESYLGDSRAEIPEDVTDEMLMPLKVGDFVIEHFVPLSRDSRNHLTGNSIYVSPERNQIRLLLWYPHDWEFDTVWGNFTRLSCGDSVGEVTTNKDWRFPYRYGRCSYFRIVGHDISWLNQGWMLTIDSGNEDPQILLAFLEDYPF